MQDRPEASYEGDYGGEVYTVEVFRTGATGTPRGKRHVVLRVRFRGRTLDLPAVVPRLLTDVQVHAQVRNLIRSVWAS